MKPPHFSAVAGVAALLIAALVTGLTVISPSWLPPGTPARSDPCARHPDDPHGIPGATCLRLTIGFPPFTRRWVLWASEPAPALRDAPPFDLTDIDDAPALRRRLATLLRMGEFHGPDWTVPATWEAFEDDLHGLPLPRTLTLVGVETLRRRMPGDAERMLEALLGAAAARRGFVELRPPADDAPQPPP